MVKECQAHRKQQQQQQKIVIEDFRFEISEISRILERRMRRTSSLIRGSAVNISYSVFSCLFFPQILLKRSALISILLMILYHSLLTIVVLHRSKRIEKKISKFANVSDFKCFSIVINLGRSSPSLNVRSILLASTASNTSKNMCLLILGILLIFFFFFLDLLGGNSFSSALTLSFFIYPLHILFFIALSFSRCFYQSSISSSVQPQTHPCNKLSDSQALARKPSHIVVNVEEDCPICLSPFNEYTSISTYFCCNNSFHTECIQTWLQTSFNCPLCRSIIS